MVKSREQVIKSAQFKMASCCGTCVYSKPIWSYDDLTPCKKLAEEAGEPGYIHVPVYGKCRHHKKDKDRGDSLPYPFM